MESSDRLTISTEVQVMYFDTDAAGVVNNIAYLRFIETARTLLALKMGMSFKEIARTGIHPVVVRTEIDYKKAALLGDVLTINGSIAEWSGARFWVNFEITRREDDQLLVTCRQSLALIQMPRGSTCSPARGFSEHSLAGVVSTRGGWQLALLIALAFALTVGTAGWGSLYNETDGQYGGAAKVMVRNGSWLIPENDGIPRLVKPPLLYWALAASMKLFGVNEFAARLPNALAVVAWVAITFLIGREMGGISRGLLAGIVLLTSLGTFTLGRIVMPEPMFSALIAAALYCVLRGVDDVAWRAAWFLGFWFFASLASFTKGWHGLLYPLAIMGVAALFRRENRINLRGLISWKGALLFLLINLPWYIYVEFRFPGYLHNLLVAEQLGHVIGASTPATHYANVPRLQFLLLQLAWLFPWSLAILAAVPIAIRSVLHRWRLPTSFPSLVVLAWFAVILGSVLLAGQRQDYYAMAMWPAVALTVAWLMERLRHSALVRSLRPRLCRRFGRGEFDAEHRRGPCFRRPG